VKITLDSTAAYVAALGDPTAQLTANLLLAVRSELQRQPPSRDNVYRALSALAFAAATVIAGTEDPAGREFFDHVLADSLAAVRSAP
jgi:hypothetical protein